MANRIRVSTEVLNAGVAGVEEQAAKVKSITGEMLNIVNNMSDAYKTTQGSVINSMNCSQGLIIWKRILKDI